MLVINFVQHNFRVLVCDIPDSLGGFLVHLTLLKITLYSTVIGV